jgi:glycosyltransferase involved in cell wall biosynthesis
LTSIWAGGLESFALTLATGLASQGFESRVYSWTGDDTWKSIFEEKGIEVCPIGGPKRIRNPLDAVRFALAWAKLVRILKRDQIEILHTHDFFPAFLGRTASLLAGVPYRVTTFHNLYEWWPRWTIYANRVLSRWTDAITCVSESVRQYMIQRDGLPPTKYVTILNGVDERRFKPDPSRRFAERQALGVADDEILIGSVGSITTRKAQWILAKAVAPLIQDGMPIQVRIWGANSSNPQHAESDLLELIRTLGISDRFRLVEPRTDIENAYNAMDIHCMTSVAEGLSLASVEAMMCGVLPVYSDIGPFREVVNEGVSGRLFHSRDPEDLEKVLREVLASSSREKWSDEIRAHAVKHFSLARLVGQYADLYRGLVTSRDKP